MKLLVLALCFSLVAAQEAEEKKPEFKPPPRPDGDVYFTESFSEPDSVWERWVRSAAKKEGLTEEIAKYNGDWVLEQLSTEGALEGDIGLVMKEAAKHYAISAKLDRPFVFEGKDAFIVQYEVNFQSGLSCGGAYVKLLSDEDLDLSAFHDKTPYSIMFGPDKCGMSSKVHFIVRFKNPETGEVEEKHSKQSTETMDFFTDKKTHLFTLLIRSDSEYRIIIDEVIFLQGNLLSDLTPPINPPREIDDPDDKMPEDWDEREKIPDPEASKPDDWDEDAPPKIPDPDAVKPEGWLDEGPEFVPDPDANKPDDWDDEEDGEWEPPMIPNPACEEVGCGTWERPMIQNPAYKGKWKPPLIDNPDYMGKWAPRKIPNPAFFEDETPFHSLLPIAAVGFELWSMDKDIFFDNIIVTSELTVANNYARDGWTLKYESERTVGGAMSLGSWLDWFVETANEYPYLWALYAFAIVLPFVLCAACCVKSKPKPKDDAATRKKTDAPSPDEPPKEEEEPPPQATAETEQSFVAAAEDEEVEEKPSEDEVKGESPSPEQEEEEASQEEGSQGPASQEEASQEEGSQGEESQGEASQEEPASEDTKEPAAATKTTKRRRGVRRED